MERRRFLKGSAVGAGTFMAGLGFVGLNEEPVENARAFPSSNLIEVPSTSCEITDALTKVQVSVTLGKFLLSPTQLTQQEFEEIMGYNPSFHRGPDLPVENVTWWEAIRYCNLRSIRESLEPCFNLATGPCDLRRNGYRLSTDAEWTHAAGSQSPPPSGNIHDIANLGSSDTKSVEHLVQDLKNSGTKSVGSYSPNRHGLYDMIGNVWEWCYDYFNPASTPQASYNPTGPGRGLARIVRGGSFESTTSEWARGYRSSMEPDYKSRFTGFRVCRTANQLSTPCGGA